MELVTSGLPPWQAALWGWNEDTDGHCFVNWKALIKYKILLLLLEPSGSCLDLQIDRISQHLLDLHRKWLLGVFFFKSLTLHMLQIFLSYSPQPESFQVPSL